MMTFFEAGNGHSPSPSGNPGYVIDSSLSVCLKGFSSQMEGDPMIKHTLAKCLDLISVEVSLITDSIA